MNKGDTGGIPWTKDRGGQCTDDILKLCFGNITFKKPNMEKRAF